MRIYLGTNDQAVDPAYSDYCEERYGPNSAPAFRGTSMLVFDRMPLDNFGNRPPQISALVVSAAADAFPYEAFSAPEPARSKCSPGTSSRASRWGSIQIGISMTWTARRSVSAKFMVAADLRSTISRRAPSTIF
jgi:hypothetical protein